MLNSVLEPAVFAVLKKEANFAMMFGTVTEGVTVSESTDVPTVSSHLTVVTLVARETSLGKVTARVLPVGTDKMGRTLIV